MGPVKKTTLYLKLQGFFCEKNTSYFKPHWRKQASSSQDASRKKPTLERPQVTIFIRKERKYKIYFINTEQWGKRDLPDTQPRRGTWHNSLSESVLMARLQDMFQDIIWIGPQMNLEIDFGDAPQPALAPRSMTSSQLQVSHIVLWFFSYENLNCRHHVLTALGIPSLKQHQMTPATDRDHPPHSGCHLHHTHPRLISQILHFPDKLHVMKNWLRSLPYMCFVAGFQWSFIPVST